MDHMTVINRVIGAFFLICYAYQFIYTLTVLFRKEKERVHAELTTVVTDYVPTILLVGTVLLLIAASQFPEKPEMTNGFICSGVAILGILYETARQRSASICIQVLKSIDYKTLLLLSGLFMVIEGITQAGVIDAIAALFVKIGGGSRLLTYVLIVGVSVLLSAFIDNIPYVATMLPVVSGIAQQLGGEPYLFAFGLLIGATLGGNITPVGASANITGIGILQREGYRVSTGDFMRIGVPFTLIAAVTGALVTWLVWA